MPNVLLSVPAYNLPLILYTRQIPKFQRKIPNRPGHRLPHHKSGAADESAPKRY